MRKLVFGLGLLVLFVGGWSVLWVYAAHEAGAQFDAWLKSEDQQGRSWTCPDRAIGGYPAAITIDCSKPTFTGHAPDQTAYGQVAHMTAEVALSHPKSLVATLQPPLTYRTSDNEADVKAGWSRLTLDLEGLPAIQTTAVHARDLVIEGTFGGGERQRTSAPMLDASFTSAAPGQDPSLDFTIALKGSAVPVVDDLLGTRAGVDVDLAGRLDHADAGNARSLEEALENWRQAGGRLDLAPSKITHGEASVSGSGALRLDDAHRPQGRIDASFVGLEPVLKRYGISGNIAAAGSILNSLFGGGRQQPAPASDTPGALNLPISLQNGRVGIGPIRTQIGVPPLY